MSRKWTLNEVIEYLEKTENERDELKRVLEEQEDDGDLGVYNVEFINKLQSENFRMKRLLEFLTSCDPLLKDVINGWDESGDELLTRIKELAIENS